MALDTGSSSENHVSTIHALGEQIIMNLVHDYLNKLPKYQTIVEECNTLPIFINDDLGEKLTNCSDQEIVSLKMEISKQIAERQLTQELHEKTQNNIELRKLARTKKELQNAISNLQLAKSQAQSQYVQHAKISATLDYLQQEKQFDEQIIQNRNQIQMIEQQIMRLNDKKQQLLHQEKSQQNCNNTPTVIADDEQKKQNQLFVQALKEWIKINSHTEVLKQLTLNIETLRHLSTAEKQTLQELLSNTQNRMVLARLETELETLCQSHLDWVKIIENLNTTNTQLHDANTQLHAILNTHLANQNQTQHTRNQYIIATFATLGATAIAAVSAVFLLQASLFIPVIATSAVLGAVSIGLFITACIYASNVNKQQQGINAVKKNILHHQQIIDKNCKTIQEYQTKEIAPLVEQINEIYTKIKPLQYLKDLEKNPPKPKESANAYDIGFFPESPKSVVLEPINDLQETESSAPQDNKSINETDYTDFYEMLGR